MNRNSIIITVVAVVVVGAAAFFGGMKYQQTQAASGNVLYAQNGGGRFGQGGGRFLTRQGGMATIGKVVSSDSNSITVQLQDGSSKIVNISGSTKIVKTTSGSQSDLTNGTQVAVFGSTNSDGSVTAQNIQINPANFGRRSMTPAPSQSQ